MNIDKECFRDPILRDRIEKEGPNVIYELFESFDRCLEKDPDGAPLYELIQGDWNWFYPNKGEETLNEILKAMNSKFTSRDSVKYSTEIEKKITIWEELKSKLKREFRYFGLEIIEDNLYIIDQMLAARESELNSEIKFFRSRVNEEKNNSSRKIEEMGPPPATKTPAGRANPLGIPYLYLCDEPETTFYEVRARYLDKVSVGTFYPTSKVRIVDFTKSVSLFDPFYNHELNNAIVGEVLAKNIIRDLSRPMSRYDSEVDYVPTQFICEYIKRRKNIQGIAFRSSLRKGFKNYVFFNSKDLECREVKVYEITEMDMKAEEK